MGKDSVTSIHKKDTTEYRTVYSILLIISICHLLNDSLQAVIPAMFPILEQSLGLTFTQLGFIAFTLNMTSSVMQPVVGLITDKRPMPYALPIGLTSSMLGMFGLAFASNFITILIAVFFIGIGSATFHPEGSRVAYLAAGTRRGFAQSIYQVGGNAGQSLAPVITALVLVPLGQFGAIWFTFVAGISVILLLYIAHWYRKTESEKKKHEQKNGIITYKRLVSKKVIANAIIILLLLSFARSWYQSAIANFYAFYVIESYGITIAKAQIYTFSFLLMGAIGTFFGGPFADRFGKRAIIIFSIVAPTPLAILLPFMNELIAIVLLCFIGLFLMSGFSVSVVYAQELIPGKVGTMSGLIVGLAFGMGAIGAVFLGSLIDWIGLFATIVIVSFLPILGFIAFFLPKDHEIQSMYKRIISS
ncbi:MAG TPA: MFS transporter [Pseudogracilibacillus sp.]|nr:MFS transporter [Pseudogracilibacillus sp.]